MSEWLELPASRLQERRPKHGRVDGMAWRQRIGNTWGNGRAVASGMSRSTVNGAWLGSRADDE